MKRLQFENAWKIALLAATVALTFAPSDGAAASRFCPQFLTQYCVVNAAGMRYTAETNPCFARREHLRILYRGQCKKRILGLIRSREPK